MQVTESDSSLHRERYREHEPTAILNCDNGMRNGRTDTLPKTRAGSTRAETAAVAKRQMPSTLRDPQCDRVAYQSRCAYPRGGPMRSGGESAFAAARP
jgi:hypothetical protein